MKRPRLATGLGLSVVLALALTGCAGLPTSGPVNAGDAVSDDESTGAFVFIPNGPAVDATPQQIVEGFIAAGSGPQNNWATAQEFLAPDFKGTWKPESGVTVYSPGLRSIEEIAEDEFVLTLSPVATVDSTGELSTAVDAGEIPLAFKVAEQPDGQWRITQAPDGIVLDQNRFAAVFGVYSLMYFDPTWTYLVPDERWFPKSYATTSIASALVDGSPSPWLAGSVATAFTDDARLAQPSVPQSARVAEVTLQEGARALDQETLNRMQTQLKTSLAGAGIVDVDMMLADDQVLDAQLVPVRSTRVDSRPLVRTPDAFGFASGGTIEEIEGLSPAIAELAAVDIEVTADRDAAAVRDENGVVWSVLSSGAATRIDTRAGLVAPSIDQFGYIWTVPAAGPTAVLAARPEGTPLSIADAWPGAMEVLAQQVSRDGTRLAAVVRDGDRYLLWAAGIIRNRDGAPTALGERKTLATLPGPAAALTWLDAATVGVLTSDDDSYLYTHEIGAFGKMLRTPAGVTSLAGGLQSGGVRLRDDEGQLYTQQGANWQHLASDIVVLAVQQGSPR